MYRPAAQGVSYLLHMPALLAVDLGLRTGLAAYAEDGRLVWYRSRNMGSRARLKAAAAAILKDMPDLQRVVVEGGGDLVAPWERAAQRRGVEFRQVHAHIWRERLLLPRQQRTGSVAKQKADKMARRVIDWSGAPKPTSLRHDAAEAILVGLWAVLEMGWLRELPVRA